MTAFVTATGMAVIGIAALSCWHGYRYRAQKEADKQFNRERRQAQLNRAAEHTIPRDTDKDYAALLSAAGSLDAEPPYDQAAVLAAAMDTAYGKSA